MFSFVGYAIFFTYLRPFLENVTHLSRNMISLVLLVYGVANLFGAIAAKSFLEKNLVLTLTLSTIVMAASILFVILFGADLRLTLIFVALFSLSFGSVQVRWRRRVDLRQLGN